MRNDKSDRHLGLSGRRFVVLVGLALGVLLSSCTEQEAAEAGEALFLIFMAVAMLGVGATLFVTGCIAIALSFIGRRPDGSRRPISIVVLVVGIVLTCWSALWLLAFLAFDHEATRPLVFLSAGGIALGVVFAVVWGGSWKKHRPRSDEAREPSIVHVRRTVLIAVASVLGAPLLMKACAVTTLQPTLAPEVTIHASPRATLQAFPVATSRPTPIQIGDRGHAERGTGDVDVQVVSSKIVEVTSGFRPDDDGLYLIVHYRVTNRTQDAIRAGGTFEWTIRSPDGTRKLPALLVGWNEPGWPDLLNVDAGASKDGWIPVRLGAEKADVVRGDYHAEWNSPPYCGIEYFGECNLSWLVLTSEDVEALTD